MSYNIQFQNRAKNEVVTIVEWYSKQSTQAALNFELALKEKLALLRNTPLRYRNTYKKFYETTLNRFPYSIVYQVNKEEKKVIIFSIFHQKRNPQKKFI